MPHDRTTNRCRYAGSWYDSDPISLRRLLQNSLAAAARGHGTRFAVDRAVRLAVVPHAGLAYSAAGMAAAFATVDAQSIDRVVILAPSHAARLTPDRLHGERFGEHQTPLGPIAGAPEFWTDDAAVVDFADDAIEREHAVELLLPYVRYLFGDAVRLAVVLVPELTSRRSVGERAGELHSAIERAGGPERTLVLVSSDFTHYGSRFAYAPYGTTAGPELEQRVAADDLALADAIASADAEAVWRIVGKRQTTVCGRYPIAVATDLASRWGYAGDRALYYNSNSADNPSAEFVCYATIVSGPEGLKQ
ncbi:MAG: AmmeMemoRadiSam system protein B [Spirochaetaceae bacterium]|nr:MAG: AmmeMemoRadiSam system protein B [Spirochaetaceae bacterium]